MNKVVLVGRVCQELELKYLCEKNIAVTRFTLAVNRSYKNAQGEHDTDFINCEVWNRQAEVFSEYFSSGSWHNLPTNMTLFIKSLLVLKEL